MYVYYVLLMYCNYIICMYTEGVTEASISALARKTKIHLSDEFGMCTIGTL